MDDNTQNICCPDLECVMCGDTDEHKHLICSQNMALLTNRSIKEMCIGDFNSCLMRRDF